MNIHDTFADGASPYWNRFAVGRAWVEAVETHPSTALRSAQDAASLRLVVGPAPADALSDAELNDHRLYPRGRWPWRPPLRMSVRARASHTADALVGTAGFGFWNAPFGADNDALYAPQAVWFFHASPPSYLSLSLSGHGSGWRAQVLNAPRVPKFVVLLGGLAWVALKPLRPLFYRAAQTQVGGGEALIAARFDEWHTYRLDWLPSRVDFFVDEQKIFSTPSSPRGPLGFCAWMDNSMLNVRDGAFAFGNLTVTEQQWLEMREVSIQQIAHRKSQIANR